MAYRIERKGHIVDSIEVADGDNVLTVGVDINVDRMLKRYTELMRLIAEIGDSDASVTDRAAKLGEAIVELFVLLFGDDQAHKIIDFYGGRHTEMLADFVPYIRDVLAPRIREAQEDIAARYKSLVKR